MEWKPSEIKTLRQALGLTQAEFAKKFSLSQSLVAYWEKGKKSPTEDGNKILEQLRKEIPTYLELCNVNAPGEIKALREALGLTQAALAKKLKISERSVRCSVRCVFDDAFYTRRLLPFDTGKQESLHFFLANSMQKFYNISSI
jgi:DNA-binding transcriptional regulator YiaG